MEENLLVLFLAMQKIIPSKVARETVISICTEYNRQVRKDAIDVNKVSNLMIRHSSASELNQAEELNQLWNLKLKCENIHNFQATNTAYIYELFKKRHQLLVAFRMVLDSTEKRDVMENVIYSVCLFFGRELFME